MAHPIGATPAHHELSPQEVGRLFAFDPASAREQLRRQAVVGRETPRPILDTECLSGNVEVRMAAAVEASQGAAINDGHDPRTENVAAIIAVPTDRKPAATCCCAGGGIRCTQSRNDPLPDKKQSATADAWSPQLQLRAERLARYVTRMVAQAPPLSPDQRDRIVALLCAGGPAA